MKNLLFIVVLCLSNSIFSNTTACDNLYSKISYALSHTKKAMEATNFEHQMYYAERALKAMEKSEGFMGDCGCLSAEDKSYFAMKSLEKAISPIDWEAGRFYTKKSKGLINDLITILDECTIDNTTEFDLGTKYNEEANSKNSMKSDSIASDNQKLVLLATQAETRLTEIGKSISECIQLLNENSNESVIGMERQQEFYARRLKQLLTESIEQLDHL